MFDGTTETTSKFMKQVYDGNVKQLMLTVDKLDTYFRGEEQVFVLQTNDKNCAHTK